MRASDHRTRARERESPPVESTQLRGQRSPAFGARAQVAEDEDFTAIGNDFGIGRGRRPSLESSHPQSAPLVQIEGVGGRPLRQPWQPTVTCTHTTVSSQAHSRRWETRLLGRDTHAGIGRRGWRTLRPSAWQRDPPPAARVGAMAYSQAGSAAH